MKERPLLKEAPMHTEQETYQSDLPRTRIKVNYPKIKVADHTQEVSKRLKRETYERETPFERDSCVHQARDVSKRLMQETYIDSKRDQQFDQSY